MVCVVERGIDISLASLNQFSETVWVVASYISFVNELCIWGSRNLKSEWILSAAWIDGGSVACSGLSRCFGDFLFSFILFLNFMSLWGTFFLWMLSSKIKIYKPYIITGFFVAQNEGLGGLSYATIGPDMVKTWSLYYHSLLLYMGIWYTKTY